MALTGWPSAFDNEDRPMPSSTFAGNDAYAPTYENRLRVVGRKLDLSRYRSIALFELEDGFVVRGFLPEARHPTVLEFAFADFERLTSEAIKGRGEGERKHHGLSQLLPTGYEDFLRALGWRLDRQLADSIIVVEMVKVFAVTGLEQVDNVGGIALRPFERYLRTQDVEQLLDESFRFRRAQEQR
jgi:hypothetical protein